ncbi:unnamed protein product [Brassicogethes aeneus]|uniref:Vitellogenin domain-containing protein n=1 Tax=Brassicogethes aeneus TaxID=1431903 RepID=A0A9P0BEU3_BRAAE|nr:unnamed protein product [Brassicogethes aeneus]
MVMGPYAMDSVGRNIFLSAIFLVSVHCVSSFENPLKDPGVCGRPQCTGNEKFKYGPGVRQDYMYSVEVRSLFNGTSRNESNLYVEGIVNLAFITPCDGILTLSDVKLSEYIPRDGHESSEHANSEHFSKEITENTLRFSFNDGIISELCPSDDEKGWVLNFKRGILSMLQNSMARFDVDHDGDEEDVRGKCFTKYAVIGAKETSLLIEKTKDLNSCQTSGKLHSAVQSVPYSSQPRLDENNILKSWGRCEMSIDQNIYNSIVCEERHVLRPLSNKEAGATSVITQNLTLINVTPAPEETEQPEITKRTNLHFDHSLTEKVTNAKLKESRDLIKKLCQQDHDDIQFQMSDLFSKFIRTSRVLSFPAIKSLHGHAARICSTGLKIFIDGLPYIGTPASVRLMKEIMLKESLTIPESTKKEWISSIAFTTKPDKNMMEITAGLLLGEKSFSHDLALSISTLTHTYCKLLDDCADDDSVQAIVQYLEDKIRQFYYDPENNDREIQESLIIALKSLSNIGIVTTNFEEELYHIIENKNIHMEVRLEAVYAFRRMPCENNRDYFEDIYMDQDRDVEIRISSYLQLMKCPNYLNIRNVKNTMLNEEVNQVGSFVWTHLNNLLKSAIPSRVEVQSILTEKDLIRKFDTDVRKFSYNREGSLYFDQFRAGGSYENNVIFSPDSYVPRSGMLNLTVNVFGESINFLEINARAEGFEQYLESLFGPKGSSYNITDKLPFRKMRWTRGIDDDKALIGDVEGIPNIKKDFNENPKVSLGFKIFGNELKYNTLSGMKEIKDALGKLNPVQHIKEILSGKEIVYNKALMFLDSSYNVASGAGLPIALNAVGTASVDIKLQGSLTGNYLKNKELDITVNIKPSVSLDISGEMSVNAFYASTGIKLKTNVYTASSVQTHAKIRGSQLVSIKTTLPRQNTELIGVRSELIVKQNDVDVPQSGLFKNRVSESICYWAVVDKAVGLKPCGDYHFTNVTEIDNVPYFLLAGPAGFRWYLNKSDPTAKIYLFEYKKTMEKYVSSYSLIFDTPGSQLKRLLTANLTIDSKKQNVTVVIRSSDGALSARVKFKNTDAEKIVELTLDVNNQKHFNALLALTKDEINNGFIFKPRAYLGVNSERVMELQGQIKQVSKLGTSHYNVDLKFLTKRLTSKLFGYITKKDNSLATDLKWDYKFQNTKEHRVSLRFGFANRSKKNMVVIKGECNLNSTAYPNFNFNSLLALYQTDNHVELNVTLDQNPLTESHPDAAKQTLKFKLSFSYKFIDSKRSLSTEVTVVRPSSNLNLKGSIFYQQMGDHFNCKLSVNSNNKEVAVSLAFSHPRTTLEQIKADLNITVPSYKPMILIFELEEKLPRDYVTNINASWFSGDSVVVRGTYQDKSDTATDHRFKFNIQDPSKTLFDEFDVHLVFYKNISNWMFDFKVNKDKYIVFIEKDESPHQVNTNAKIKYKKQLYTMNAIIYSGEYRRAEIELKIDQLRDIHFLVSLYNQKTYKAIEFDIKWDANRDPTQKLLLTANFSQIAQYNQVSDFVMSYPGRTILGKYEFFLDRGKIDALASISWDDDKSLGFDLLIVSQHQKGFSVNLDLKVITPFESWRIMMIKAKFEHLRNMYLLNGGVTWDHRQKIEVNCFGDRYVTPFSSNYNYTFKLDSTLRNIPSVATKIIHYQNSSTLNSNLHFKYNPEFEIDVDSKWSKVVDNINTNLTGTVFLKTPFRGLNTGVLISKIYFTDQKYVRGIADLNLDNKKKVLINLEGRFRKFTNSKLIVNVTADDEDYQARFIISEEKRHFVAQAVLPNRTLGTELLLQMHSLSDFDIKFTLDTPIQFIRSVLIVARLQPGDADFRLGWNFLVVGFSGVWHYVNVTDFEYTYKIYTPLEGFEENGVVGKLICQEGLDLEVSIKLYIHKLGLKLRGKPKPRPLKELDIKIEEIYGTRLEKNIKGEKETKEPISWAGLVEIDVITYPTIKGKLEIDQHGPFYSLRSKMYFPGGKTVILHDDFEYHDMLKMKNVLEIQTPYEDFKQINSNVIIYVVRNETYLLDANFDYQNKTKIIKTSFLAKYLSETKEVNESRLNATLKIVTPFNALPKLDACAEYESEENFYRARVSGSTLGNYLDFDVTEEIENELTEIIGNLKVKTKSYYIPPVYVNVKKHFTEIDNGIAVRISCPERLKKEIYLNTSWLIKSEMKFRTLITLESPFSGLENITGGIDVHIGDYKSNIWAAIYLNPVTIQISSSLIDNDLQINSTLDLNRKRIPINVVCKFYPDTNGLKHLNGTLQLKNKLFNITGHMQFKSKIPVNVSVQLRPVDGTDTLKLQYEIQQVSTGYKLAGTVQRSDKMTEFDATTAGSDIFNWKCSFKVRPPSKKEYIMHAEAIGNEDSKNLAVNLTTPIPKLETPKFGLSLLSNGLRKTINGYFELPESKGGVNINLIWVVLENMMVKVNAHFKNSELEKNSHLDFSYLNPNKEYKSMQIGADVNIDKFWEGGSNVTVHVPSSANVDLQAHIKLPSTPKDVHSLSTSMSYGSKFKNINYQAKYRTSQTNKKYGSSGQINIRNEEDLSGEIEVEWDGKMYNNFANLKKPKGAFDLIYKLKTPKHKDQNLFVGLFNFKTLDDRYNVSGEAFYPENKSVAYGTVNYKELGNMHGMLNISLQYKKIKHAGARFNTETSAAVYNRYLKVFWNNDSATLDGICNIVQGQEKSETKGRFNLTLPLNTTHIVLVDFNYDKAEVESVGAANVHYNGDKVLVGKYKCVGERREHFNKKTIVVELENDRFPIGAHYVHGTATERQHGTEMEGNSEKQAAGERLNAPAVVNDSKYLNLFNLKNASKFNVTGELKISTRTSGQDYFVTVTHLNRTAKFWMDYDVLAREYKQHGRMELSPTIWIDYDLNLLNRTVDQTFDAQQIQINVSYPRRNFTAQSFYNISDSIVSTDVSLMLDKDNKTVQAGVDWIRASPNKDQIHLTLKHPSFERDVTLLVSLKGSLGDKSNSFTSNYTYMLEAEHAATSLSLKTFGDLYWNNEGYGTEHLTFYKRTYLAMSEAVTFAKVNFTHHTIELKNENNVAGLSYLWGRYGGKFPVYTANISATHGINDTSGEFYLNLKKKLLYLDFNMTRDGSQSLHVHGLIPDARSAIFDIWRKYEDIRVSDLSYYLRLNHSRLITSSLLWRKEAVSDVQNGIRNSFGVFYNDSLKSINETQQYVIAQSLDALHDIWLDAKPLVNNFLEDLRNLTVIADDFEEFKKFLNESYQKNEFYIKDIATVVNTIFDESLKSRLSSLPKIVQEIWEVMGSSAEKINKTIKWAVEKLKTYYTETADFVKKLIYGDPIEHLTNLLKTLVEKYDEYIKSMHVAVIQYMEKIWSQTYLLIVNHWHKFLRDLEPTFLKIIHYLESIVWSTGKEFLDFLYIRKTEIIGNPYFAKLSNFTQDVDKFYRDITGNNTISSIYKYTKIAWNFLKEKYLNNVPFAKEVKAVISEIIWEVAELQNIPAVKYLTSKWNESYEFVRYYYEYFVIESNLHKVFTTVYFKLTDNTPTALETDNKQRKPKTKFIFEPNDGVMLLEQKLPMSWHAFNETPKYQEIPEIKALYALKDYFSVSELSFWNFYNNYRQYTDPSDWMPPFKGQAMLIGNKHYVTFDRKYYDFQGGCTYLLATDLRDGNFTLLASYDVTQNTNEFLLIVNKTVLYINVFDDTVRIGNSGMADHLPADIGHAYVYREADILTVESPLGFVLKCNMKFHICTLQLSGWYFGKTAGLLGTLNNEPSDDLLQSNQTKAKDNQINTFAQSWTANQNCRTAHQPTKKIIDPMFKPLCESFFQSKQSDLENCFSKIPVDPFWNMCLESTSETEACSSAVAYIEVCGFQDVPLRIPDTCVRCDLFNGTQIKEGRTVRLGPDQMERSADIVFIVEAKQCNNNIKRTKNIDTIIESLDKELNENNITNNRYSLVVFGGKGVYDQPRSVAVNGKMFSDHKNFGKYFENIPVGNGNQDVFEALLYARDLVLRPGASKSFILIPCSKCDESKMMDDYSTVHYQLFESSVSLHIIMHAEFSQKKDKDNKVFGIDSTFAYSKRDVRSEGDTALRKDTNLPKSALGICTPLALEMNGSIFTSKYLDKKYSKRLSTVFSRRVAKSAEPKSCMDCECTGSNSGVSFMECILCRG